MTDCSCPEDSNDGLWGGTTGGTFQGTAGRVLLNGSQLVRYQSAAFDLCLLRLLSTFADQILCSVVS